jgi:hypothetical protein
LLDLSKNLVELQRVFADNSAFQEKRVGRARAISHLSQSVDPLIGINPNDRTRARSGLRDDGDSQVRDSQSGRARIYIHRFGIGLEGVGQQVSAERQRRGLQNITPSHHAGVLLTHRFISCM